MSCVSQSPVEIDERLTVLIDLCVGAYSPNTLRSYREDLRQFNAWCCKQEREWLPASPETVSGFVDELVTQKKVSTIKRQLCAIKFAHRIRNLDCPTNHSSVQLAIRRAARTKPRRPTQSLGLTAKLLRQIVEKCPETLSGLRDAALMSVGYDTLCRSSELAVMRVEHISLGQNRQPTVLIPTSKGDVEGDGRVAYLSPPTQDRLERWLARSGITDGPLFRGLHTGKVSNRGLETCSIRRLLKMAAQRAQLDQQIVAGLSGHSMRIGAAQDMLLAGFDTLAIMQAGGWKTPAVVLRYVENAMTQSLHERRWLHLDRYKTGSGWHGDP